MAKVKLELRSKTNEELQTLGDAHKLNMTGNAAFPTPDPTPAVYDAGLTAYTTKRLASEAADATAKMATAAFNSERKNFEATLTRRGTYVDDASGGDEAKILSTGFDVRATGAPIGDLPAPVDFLATMGDALGEIDLTWSAVRGAKAYLLEYHEHLSNLPWLPATPVTASRTTVDGLTPGKTYAFRVRAVGTAGPSPWSDESVRMAPG